LKEQKIQNLKDKDYKVIIFSDYSYIFQYIEKICVDNDIKYVDLDKGNIKDIDNTIQCLKIDVQGGLERQFVYRFLDDGFRPSLVLVRWSNDVDDHYSTAICVGHLLNCGYGHVRMENNYSLYFFEDRPLYDICSMKTLGSQNPIMRALLNVTKTSEV
jgi:DNA-binding phage protein